MTDVSRIPPRRSAVVAQYTHGSALFLDRDGVINVDRGYVYQIDQFEFLPGIFELARFWTNEVRGQIVVVSNQSGIGRGYFDESAYAKLTRWIALDSMLNTRR
jgi:histidinol phosphatase-like enzyme